MSATNQASAFPRDLADLTMTDGFSTRGDILSLTIDGETYLVSFLANSNIYVEDLLNKLRGMQLNDPTLIWILGEYPHLKSKLYVEA